MVWVFFDAWCSSLNLFSLALSVSSSELFIMFAVLCIVDRFLIFVTLVCLALLLFVACSLLFIAKEIFLRFSKKSFKTQIFLETFIFLFFNFSIKTFCSLIRLKLLVDRGCSGEKCCVVESWSANKSSNPSDKLSLGVACRGLERRCGCLRRN